MDAGRKYGKRMNKKYSKQVARSRFELLSRDPESPMIDHYTNGLNYLNEYDMTEY